MKISSHLYHPLKAFGNAGWSTCELDSEYQCPFSGLPKDAGDRSPSLVYKTELMRRKRVRRGLSWGEVPHNHFQLAALQGIPNWAKTKIVFEKMIIYNWLG